LSNSCPKIHVYIPGHRYLGEPNAAGKSKVSKRLAAVVFVGKSVREQRCLILKTKTLKNFEEFSSKNISLHPPWTPEFSVSRMQQQISVVYRFGVT
jgi:hypothetical protein